MTTPTEDPRITAYLTNELSADERQQFETELTTNPELAAEVDDMRELLLLVGDALDTETCPQLSDDERDAVLHASPAATDDQRKPRPILPIMITLAASAAIAGTVLFQRGVFSPRNELRERGEILSAQIAKVTEELDRETPNMVSTGPTATPSAPPKPKRDYRGGKGPAPVSARPSLEVMEDSSDDRPEQPVPLSHRRHPGEILGKNLHLGDAKIKKTPIAQQASSQPVLEVNSTLAIPPGNKAQESGLQLQQQEGWNREAYNPLIENDYRTVSDHPLSTFSIDVDTAAYANMRRFITNGQLPPKDAIRIEEMINYFDYDYPEPQGEHPFSVGTELVDCPWNAKHRLARIGLKGQSLVKETAPACNLVFLIDVSGSMSNANKLPLLKDAMKMLANNLRPQDTVAITVYAGSAGLVLPPTSGRERHKIITALDRLKSGGSTNGGAGIHLAYKVAQDSFVEGGANRVILASDGDFNVGTTDQGSLVRLVTEKAKSGVFLTVLGFGMGNYQDARLEQIANKGNGNYGYIDNRAEARKVLVEQMNGTLVTIAKDVKIQVEFNPAKVAGYRLIGYENRMLKKEDFNDDKKDAGEIGAGHTVTALYEIVPKGVPVQATAVDSLKYQSPQPRTPQRNASNESFTVKLRYKEPAEGHSKLIEHPVIDDGNRYAHASPDMKFAASVASFGMLLRDSKHKGNCSFEGIQELAEEGMLRDPHGYRAEFLQLVKRARTIQQR